jgi:hypothetical protein
MKMIVKGILLAHCPFAIIHRPGKYFEFLSFRSEIIPLFPTEGKQHIKFGDVAVCVCLSHTVLC